MRRPRVHLGLAEMEDPVPEKIDHYALMRTIEPAHFWPAVHAAVDAFGASTGAEWQGPVA
jgi:hypothetical protein